MAAPERFFPQMMRAGRFISPTEQVWTSTTPWTGITRINGVYDLATEAVEVSGDVLVADGSRIVSSAFEDDKVGLTASGSFTVQGALTFDLTGFSGGTYTLVSAENVIFEAGATVALSNVGELTGVRRTLTCTDNSILLTVERDGSLDEYVFNGNFALDGTTLGNASTAGGGANWAYSNNPGFTLPWWKTSDTGYGLTVTNTPWFESLNLQDVFIGAMVLASSGAVMDLAMDIASGIDEVARHNPELSGRELCLSGLRIGRSVVGTMTTTLLLAYSGGYITLLMVFCTQGTHPLDFLNNALVASEVVKTLIGSFSLIFVAPSTALIAAWIFSMKKTVR